MKGRAGLICSCGSHEVVYTDTAGMYRCEKCGDVSPLLPISFVDGAFVYTYGNMGNFQLRQEVLVNCEIVGNIHDTEVAE